MSKQITESQIDSNEISSMIKNFCLNATKVLEQYRDVIVVAYTAITSVAKLEKE